MRQMSLGNFVVQAGYSRQISLGNNEYPLYRQYMHMNNAPHAPVCLALATAILLLFSAVSQAEAARFGGRSSFGGRPAYQRSVPAPTPAAPSGQRMNQEPRATPQQGMAAFPRSGGMLGGLLAGSMLGALLFGGHAAGVGVADIMLLTLAAFIGLKILQGMRRRTAAPDASSPLHKAGADDAWQALRSAPPLAGGDAAYQKPPMPDSFNEEEFLKGAKMLYARLQHSWDIRDLDDIAQFATPAVLHEITRQAQADPAPSRTDLLLVNADLISVAAEGNEEVASVYFDVLMREDPREQTGSQVREIWHFCRELSPGAGWKLDGIQQVQ